MLHDDADVSEALKKVAPTPAPPPGLLEGARRRRARSRARTGALAGVGVLAVAVGIVGPGLGLGLGTGGSVGDTTAQLSSGAAEGSNLPAKDSSADMGIAARAAQSLGWGAILRAGPGNQVVSPSSLSLSLAMAAEGAEGASLASVDAALGLSGDARSAAYAGLRGSLAGYETSPDKVDLQEPPTTPQIHLANRLVTLGAEAERPFVERLERWFDVPVAATTHDDAKALLDAWAREHTAGLIEQSAIDVVPELRLVTQDALLFSAAWAVPFTNEIDAFEFDGVGAVEAMNGVVPARYAEGERWTAVRLDYDDRLAADVILPKEGLAPTDLTEADLEDADRALTAAAEQQVDVTMPRLDLRSKVDLQKALPDIDLTDLGGMFDGAFAGQWVQQSVLQVSAKGTVGAALTEMGVYESMVVSDVTFVADRGYVVRVVDTKTHWPLFLASVLDPGA